MYKVELPKITIGEFIFTFRPCYSRGGLEDIIQWFNVTYDDDVPFEGLLNRDFWISNNDQWWIRSCILKILKKQNISIYYYGIIYNCEYLFRKWYSVQDSEKENCEYAYHNILQSLILDTEKVFDEVSK